MEPWYKVDTPRKEIHKASHLTKDKGPAAMHLAVPR